MAEMVAPPVAAASLDVICPADGALVGRVPAMDAAAVAQLADQLRAAQLDWEAIGPRGRAVWLSRWRDWILDNRGRLLELTQQESGKSWGDTTGELQVCLEVLNYYASRAPKFLAEQTPRPHGLISAAKRLRLTYRPHPLVGVISPWNYPLCMPMMDIAPALMAGCAVLSKPSEETPLAWQEVVRGWREEIGAPKVLTCVTGRAEAGAAVVELVDMVQFTGSVATGRKVGARAGERLIPCSLELGGNDAMLVLADADVERAARGATWGSLYNAGQSCIAVERIYVEAPVYDQFVEQLVENVQGLRQGMDAPGTFATDVGACATQAQIATVQRHVDDAVARGARVLTGGQASAEGLFFAPTVLVDVDHTMECMRSETFGPILPVMRVADAEEAVRLANDSPLGLSATVWTRDRRRGRELARRLEVGAVLINDAMANIFQFAVPHGGWRDSGVGSRFGGANGIRKFCRTQAVLIGRMDLKSEVQWYPYSPAKSQILGRLTVLLGARDWRRRLGREKH
ncbi:MAG: aldehyde dehydrogenase [Conexibacter sp.]|nr:aldehyde dehydrogenase [Conexibacter sp.]